MAQTRDTRTGGRLGSYSLKHYDSVRAGLSFATRSVPMVFTATLLAHEFFLELEPVLELLSHFRYGSPPPLPSVKGEREPKRSPVNTLATLEPLALHQTLFALL